MDGKAIKGAFAQNFTEKYPVKYMNSYEKSLAEKT